MGEGMSDAEADLKKRTITVGGHDLVISREGDSHVLYFSGARAEDQVLFLPEKDEDVRNALAQLAEIAQERYKPNQLVRLINGIVKTYARNDEPVGNNEIQDMLDKL